MNMELRIRKKVSKAFTLEVDIKKGDTHLGLLGPSGSGKSMTLKCIAGITTPDEGYIAVNGRVLYDSAAKVNLKPRDRRVGYMFQEYALFPRMTVLQNLACGLAKGGEAALPALMARFGLEGLEGRYPRQLSGGQQQRVALARMLARKPDVVLLDEPFAALDPHLREQVQLELTDLLQDCRDVILVTHNRSEAYRFCGELALIEQGRVLAQDGTKELFDRPGTVSVARLTGCKNLSPARQMPDGGLVATNWGVTLRAAAPVADDITWLGVRAHNIELLYAPTDAENTFAVQVVGAWEDLFEWNLLCRAGAECTPLWIKRPKSAYQGPPTHLRIPPEALLLLREDAVMSSS